MDCHNHRHMSEIIPRGNMLNGRIDKFSLKSMETIESLWVYIFIFRFCSLSENLFHNQNYFLIFSQHDHLSTVTLVWKTAVKTNTTASLTGQILSGVPGKVTVDVSQDLHEVRVDRGEADTGSFSHVDGALLCQIHVVEVDELKLGLFLWAEQTKH